jgi:NADH:ubiquinone oxidoreductase subunit 5 (subunit L)/multisubunit Na+/H+ antiporter MnhA subunit
MAIGTFLAIASFAISVGGLIPVFFFKNRRKEVALAVVIALLVAMTGVALYRHHQYNQLISQVENEIIDKLSSNTWTFDQLYQELHYVPFQVVNEALFHAVEKGVIGYRLIEFRSTTDGSTQQVRAYYVESPP